MSQIIIKDFDELVIEKKGQIPNSALDLEGHNILLEDEEASKKGFYNGKVLGEVCKRRENKRLILECYCFNFFDFFSKRIKKGFIPKLVNVNAIIKFKDKNSEKYILLFKRGSEVFAYKNYWDFPAGFVHYEESLIDRLTDRIEFDIKINGNLFDIKNKPLLYENKNLSGLYYEVNLKISKEELERILASDIEKGRIVLLKKSDVQNFLKDNKVYPVFLEELF